MLSRRLFGRLLCAGLSVRPLLPDSAHPFLGGRWQLEPDKSSLGNLPKYEHLVEVIDHQEPRIVITTLSKLPGKAETSLGIQYTTDSKENSTYVGNDKFTSRTKWDGPKLVTVIIGPNGEQMLEMRYLSKDHMYQAIDLYIGRVGAKPDQTRMMRYKGPR